MVTHTTEETLRWIIKKIVMAGMALYAFSSVAVAADLNYSDAITPSITPAAFYPGGDPGSAPLDIYGSTRAESYPDETRTPSLTERAPPMGRKDTRERDVGVDPKAPAAKLDVPPNPYKFERRGPDDPTMKRY
jgi:hypothetical protein